MCKFEDPHRVGEGAAGTSAQHRKGFKKPESIDTSLTKASPEVAIRAANTKNLFVSSVASTLYYLLWKIGK